MQVKKIQKLAANLANQIAAGEVVARPASVFKETVENSIDAGADKIDIIVEEGGLKLLEIRDNGTGIKKEELELAITRHATSKISSLEDLEKVASFGFRGEALAAISSVSRFELISLAQGEKSAWRLSFDPTSAQSKILEYPHAQGTSLIVKDLFFNTPARRKFLRTPRTEFSHIEKSMRNFALAFPKVSFKLRHNGKIVWDLLEQNLAQRCKKIMGDEFIEKSLVINSQLDDMQLVGFVGLPQIAKSTTDSQYFFVNNRPVSDRSVSHAIKQAYADIMYGGKQPTFVLFLQMPTDAVDVNVHPTKNEVRFRQQNQIHSFIYSSLHRELSRPLAGRTYNLEPNVQNNQAEQTAQTGANFQTGQSFQAGQKFQTGQNWQNPSAGSASAIDFLQNQGSSANYSLQNSPSAIDFSNTNFLDEELIGENNNLPNSNISTNISTNTNFLANRADSNFLDKPVFAQANTDSNLTIALDSQLDLFDKKYADTNSQQNLSENLKIPPMGFALAQIKETFILSENAQGLLIVDMHAAHERIIYEELKRQLAEDRLTTQNLLFPLELEFEASLIETAETHLDLLKSLGLGLSILSERKIGINYFPSILQQNNAEALVTEVLQELHNFGSHTAVKISMERCLVSMSCQGAWRTGKKLNLQQMNYLLREMEITPNSDECCHGRLTWKQFTMTNLNSFFKRGQ